MPQIRSLKVKHSFFPPVLRGSPRGRSRTYWKPPSWLLSPHHGEGRDSSISHKGRGTPVLSAPNLIIYSSLEGLISTFYHMKRLCSQHMSVWGEGGRNSQSLAAYKHISHLFFVFCFSFFHLLQTRSIFLVSINKRMTETKPNQTKHQERHSRKVFKHHNNIHSTVGPWFFVSLVLPAPWVKHTLTLWERIWLFRESHNYYITMQMDWVGKLFDQQTKALIKQRGKM